MIFSGINPFRMIQEPFTAVTLGVVLNLFFSSHPELKERLKEMGGKVFRFQVEDLDQEYFMTVDDDGGVRIHSYSDDDPNVTMAGSMSAFLSLLVGSRDPDSLFFSRELKLSGETDLGLRFKNILDNVEWSLEEAMAAMIGGPAAKGMAGLFSRAREMGQKGRDRMEEGMERMAGTIDLPRKADLEPITAEAEALGERAGRLERGVSRLGKRLAVARR